MAGQSIRWARVRVLLYDLPASIEERLVDAFATSGQPVALARQAAGGGWDLVLVSGRVEEARALGAPHSEVWVVGTGPRAWSEAPDDVIEADDLRPAALTARLDRLRRSVGLARALDLAEEERRGLLAATRRSFEQELARAEATAERHGTPFGVVVVASDGAAADAMDDIASRFRAADRWVRVSPTRWAGVLVADADGVAAAAARLRAEVEARWSGVLTVVAVPWRTGMRARELLRRTDEALLASDGERAAG
jgi:hypothetical protein